MLFYSNLKRICRNKYIRTYKNSTIIIIITTLLVTIYLNILCILCYKGLLKGIMIIIIHNVRCNTNTEFNA